MINVETKTDTFIVVDGARIGEINLSNSGDNYFLPYTGYELTHTILAFITQTLADLG